MNIAIDTNALVDFFRGKPAVKKEIQKYESIYVPFIVLAELRAGFLSGKRGLENEKVLTLFLNSPRTEILLASEDTTHHYAKLFQQLRSQGTPIPTNDLWIASLCLQYDFVLLSSDKHFQSIPQLIQINPSEKL